MPVINGSSPVRPTLPTTTVTSTPVAQPVAQTASDTAAYFRDPDSFFASAIDTHRGLALVRGMQGNVFGQAMHMGTAAVLDAQWKALQLNPLTARFYDGRVPTPGSDG
jgi:hypothetical protein